MPDTNGKVKSTELKSGTASAGSDSSDLLCFSLSFQKYEIDLISEGLAQLVMKEYSDHCKWEEQPNGGYFYTPNKKVRQIRFIQRSINRQLEA
jgi:hypothetical protein